ncbi:hypothetical protein AJ78_02534 [Emergomyces pasteurianus Ep9510]|uniref:Uncharacterized protein n=1 Tax=Emergomyces pasteurianus Ep9510 TaxID=1447872 RepID=A0A1J9QQ21_9EURO|nr:hypothetical protein AJ78_02534 [Emergomyces pasteurianus Ep9510]
MKNYRRSSTAGSRPASTERHRQSPTLQGEALTSTMSSESLQDTPTSLEDYSRIMHRHTQQQIEKLPPADGQKDNDGHKSPNRSPPVSPHNKQRSNTSS